MYSLRLSSGLRRAKLCSHPFPPRLSIVSHTSVLPPHSFHGSKRTFVTIPGVPSPEEDEDGAGSKKEPDHEKKWRPMLWKMLESTATTLASVAVLG